MKILYNNNFYPCKCRINSSSIVYSGLPEDFTESVSGEIILMDNDEFELRRDIVEDYLRQTFVNGVLTLTNEPVPEPVPVPVPEAEPTTEEILDTLLGVNEDE
jgi:hypothetical protein